jgi:hypothetical protein
VSVLKWVSDGAIGLLRDSDIARRRTVVAVRIHPRRPTAAPARRMNDPEDCPGAALTVPAA